MSSYILGELGIVKENNCEYTKEGDYCVFIELNCSSLFMRLSWLSSIVDLKVFMLLRSSVTK